MATKFSKNVFPKVGRAPAALNFADDTGWDTDWLRLERAWASEWRMLSSENRNKKHPINRYAVGVVDFLCLKCVCVSAAVQSISRIFVFQLIIATLGSSTVGACARFCFENELVIFRVGTRRQHVHNTLTK